MKLEDNAEDQIDGLNDKRDTKSRFNIVLSNVWCKCMIHNNIIGGFKATPLNL